MSDSDNKQKQLSDALIAQSLFALEETNKKTTPSLKKAKPEAKHYHGHRDRLRARFADNGSDGLADYELLELILFQAIPRKDTKPLAKDLIKKFGSFGNVLGASIDDLCAVKGVSYNCAVGLKAIQAGAQMMLQQHVMNRDIISSWNALVDYCRSVMGTLKIEQFRVLFLDKKNRLIADEVQQEGTIDHTPVYPREVIKRALALNATAIILVHNHPSGDPKPSKADIEVTNDIIAAGKAIGIIVHDHVIVARNETASFRNMGLI